MGLAFAVSHVASILAGGAGWARAIWVVIGRVRLRGEAGVARFAEGAGEVGERGDRAGARLGGAGGHDAQDVGVEIAAIGKRGFEDVGCGAEGGPVPAQADAGDRDAPTNQPFPIGGPARVARVSSSSI